MAAALVNSQKGVLCYGTPPTTLQIVLSVVVFIIILTTIIWLYTR